MCTFVHELMKTMHEYKFILFVNTHTCIFCFISFSSVKGVFCYCFFDRLIWLIFENSLKPRSNQQWQTWFCFVVELLFRCQLCECYCSQTDAMGMMKPQVTKVWRRRKLWEQVGKKEESWSKGMCGRNQDTFPCEKNQNWSLFSSPGNGVANYILTHLYTYI